MVAVTAIVAGAVGAGVGVWASSTGQRTIIEQFFPNRSVLAHPADVQAVLARVEPAVVSIQSQSAPTAASGDFVQAAGTGMIITSDGEVLTNDHVIAGAAAITVTLFGQTQERPARVIGTDPPYDLALVQIEHASGLPAVVFGSSATARVGDEVLAIGNALALSGGPSVTQGIISAEHRSLTATNDAGQTEDLTGLLQTDAAINPGNSGGPLVDASAHVIGMNTAVASSSAGNAPAQNIGFAIPVDTITARLAELRRGGTGGSDGTGSAPAPAANTAYLGVTVGPVTSAVRELEHLTPSSGALVLAVEPGSPAASAGIEVGDVVVSFDGTPITSPEDVTAAIHPHAPGDHVQLGLYRGPTRLTVDVTLGANPAGG